MRQPILMRVGDTLWPGCRGVAVVRLQGNVNEASKHKKSPAICGALILCIGMGLGDCHLNTVARLGLASRNGRDGDTAPIAVLESVASRDLAILIHIEPDLGSIVQRRTHTHDNGA